MRKRRHSASDPGLIAFLEHAQANVGGYYKTPKGECVEFIRPLGNLMMRVKNMKTGLKFNIEYPCLEPLNEMQVLAMQLSDGDDILKAEPRPPDHE